MNELKKSRMANTFKYTWPTYVVVGLFAFGAMSFIFRTAHPTPAYKTLTLFVTGRVNDDKKLKEDILDKYQDNQLKVFSCISSSLTDGEYHTKLTVAGYASADVLILPVSVVENLDIGSIAIDLKDGLVATYYASYDLYAKESINYGVKIDKEKVEQYMTLPDEDCYMFLNGNSKNLGEYSLKEPDKEHNNALNVVKDWGM